MKKFLNKLSLVILLLSPFFYAAPAAAGQAAAVQGGVLNPAYWKTQALQYLIPFWEKTIDKDDGGFFTDINENGSVWGPGNKYPRMISRVVFGFSAAYMLSGDKRYLETAQKIAKAQIKYTWDEKYGECYQTLARDGTPVNKVKGTLFKSAYHSMEQALFSYLYLSLYVNRSEATLYFNLSADTAGEKHYVNLLEDPAVFIKNVEIDGKPWTDFDASGGSISLPAGKNMKIKVTFAIH
jgi:hypothetical protein